MKLTVFKKCFAVLIIFTVIFGAAAVQAAEKFPSRNIEYVVDMWSDGEPVAVAMFSAGSY
jgi:hypothetical protein